MLRAVASTYDGGAALAKQTFSALPELYLAPLAAYAERAIRGLNVI
jgi:hypothetical protein